MADEIDEKRLRKLIREEVDEAIKSSKPMKIEEGATDDEIDRALASLKSEEETYDCPKCGYKSKTKFDICPNPNCGAKVGWD